MAKTRPKIAGVNFKEIISNSFEKISNQKGKVSITDIVKDTGYSKPTVYKYLTESQNNQLLSQPSPFKDKITKQVNQIIDDVFKNKKPLINASPNKIYEKIYGKKFNIKTDNIGVIKNILKDNPNWPKIREAVTNTSTRVGSGNKSFEKIKFKEFDKALSESLKARSMNRAGTAPESILRDLKRHIEAKGNKYAFAKGNSLDEGFVGLKIKDLKNGDVLTLDSIKEGIKNGDPRFQEYNKVFNDIKKLKLTPYINPTTKEKTTLMQGLQKATGVEAPLNIQHNKGVRIDPLKNLSIQTHKANLGAKMVKTSEDAKALGVRTKLPGSNKIVGPELSFDDQINRLTKFADRKILQTEASGFVKPKTPTETLNVTRAMPEYNSELGAFVNNKTPDFKLQDPSKDLTEFAKANPIPEKAIADPSLLKQTMKSTGKLLGGLLSTLGTPTAAAGFAGLTIKGNLDEGKNIADAVVDPMVGAELLFPEVAKRTIASKAPGILSKALTLGRVGSMFTPVGAGITALGIGKELYNVARDQQEMMDNMTEEERLEFDAQQQQMSEFGA
jgi:hypothetical protein